jgi:two-component system, response regulator / RNA-binding antiterminator
LHLSEVVTSPPFASPQPPAPTGDLVLVVITASADVPDLVDERAWQEAVRLRELVQGLQGGGYRIAGVLAADASLPAHLARLAPDLLIVDAESGARDTLEHVVFATREAPRPIVLFTEEHDAEHMREAVAAGVVAYVVAGLAPERVRPVIDVAMARFEHERQLRSALAVAEERLRDRDTIARAKTMLMQRHQLSEPQAYARLRKAAMNHSLTIEEVARRLLDVADLFS